MRNLRFSKFKKENQYSILNNKLKKTLKKRNFQGKLIIPKLETYKKLKPKLKNLYLKSDINDENMSFVYSLIKLLKIKNEYFLKSLNNFVGLPHRYEIFFKKKTVFINDSKATSFQATKFALENTKNILWIVGGLPKIKDKISLEKNKKKYLKAYIIGKNTNFLENKFRIG